MMTRFRVILSFLISSSLAISGCGGGSTFRSVDLQGSERSAFIPAFRTTVDFRKMGTTFIFDRMEFDIAYGAGKSSQQILTGQSLVFEGANISGPAEIFSDYKLYAGSVSFLGDFISVEDVFSFDGIIGLGLTYLDLDIKSGGVAAGGDTSSAGMLLGAQISGKPISELNLYLRGGVIVGQPILTLFEWGVAVSPRPDVSIVIGWRRWHYVDEDDNDILADIDLKLSGPMAGVHLNF